MFNFFRLIMYLLYYSGHAWLQTIAIIIVSVIFILFIIGLISKIFNKNSSQTQLNNEYQINNSLNNENYQTIQWTDISTFGQTDSVVFDKDFLVVSNNNSAIEDQLTNLIGQKDRVSQEIFRAGEKVYYCVSCQLGYHEDSWQFLDMKCDQCNSSNVSMYSLPLTVVRENKKPTTDKLLTEINFKDINSDEVLRNLAVDTEYYLYQGIEHLKSKNYIRAIEDFTNELQLNPANYNNAEIYYNRGIAYHKNKNYQEAIEDYSLAIMVNNNHANAYCNRGNVFYIIGNLQEAISDYNQVININPNHSQAAKNLDLACAKLRSIHQQRKTNSNNSNNSIKTEIYEECISALDRERLRRNVNQIISVKGKIKGVYVDEDNCIIYFVFTENDLNGFYAYVPASSFNKFKNSTIFLEQNVIVSGRVTLNSKNQPRIILNNEQQLRSID